MSDTWDTFAAANDGLPACISSNVIGQELWPYFADQESVLIYKKIYQQVRELKREAILPIHCDSLDTVRRLEMHIRPLPDQHLEIHFILLSSEQRNLSISKDAKPDKEVFLEMCSYCGSARNSQGQYTNLSDVIAENDLFATHLPKISHTVCEACIERMMKDLKLNHIRK